MVRQAHYDSAFRIKITSGKLISSPIFVLQNLSRQNKCRNLNLDYLNLLFFLNLKMIKSISLRKSSRQFLSLLQLRTAGDSWPSFYNVLFIFPNVHTKSPREIANPSRQF